MSQVLDLPIDLYLGRSDGLDSNDPPMIVPVWVLTDPRTKMRFEFSIGSDPTFYDFGCLRVKATIPCDEGWKKVEGVCMPGNHVPVILTDWLTSHAKMLLQSEPPAIRLEPPVLNFTLNPVLTIGCEIPGLWDRFQDFLCGRTGDGQVSGRPQQPVQSRAYCPVCGKTSRHAPWCVNAQHNHDPHTNPRPGDTSSLQPLHQVFTVEIRKVS